MRLLTAKTLPQFGDWYVHGLQRFPVSGYDTKRGELLYIKDYATRDEPLAIEFKDLKLLDKDWSGPRYWIAQHRVAGKRLQFQVEFRWIGGVTEVIHTQAVSMKQARVNALYTIGVRWLNRLAAGGDATARAKKALCEINNATFDWSWLVPSLLLKN